ncbi:hypothetical protein Avbf_03935 [Armadillidium vulgare]|nr:hypothetical protein Avbf_03935 [Armadillidium vulgare]
MDFDFMHSKDLYEIREKVLKLDKELRNTDKEEEVITVEEQKSEHLIKRLEEADKQIFSLTTKLRNLIDNYATFSSNQKKNLATKVSDLKKKNKEIIELLEDSWKEKLLHEESQSHSLKEELDEVKKNHASSLDILKKQHHDELENFRIQFEVLQRSFPSNCGMNIYSQKISTSKIGA